jgi:hypothetical protein
VGGCSTSRPGRFTSGKDPVPLYRRLSGLQGRSGRMLKISPPPGFDSRTVQPVANRYTDWAILPHTWNCTSNKFQTYAFMGPCSVNYRDIFTKTAGNLLIVTVNVTHSRKTIIQLSFIFRCFERTRARIHSSIQSDQYRTARIFHVSLQCVFSIHAPFALLQKSRKWTIFICFDLLLKMWLDIFKRYR